MKPVDEPVVNQAFISYENLQSANKKEYFKSKHFNPLSIVSNVICHFGPLKHTISKI